jgi:hypothetical protein
MAQEIKVAIREYKNAKKGDVLVFDGEKWEPVALEKILEVIITRLEKVETLPNAINILKRQIAKYLKEDLK